MEADLIKVLLVEDDEDDYIIARDLFAEIRGNRFTLEWAKTFQSGLDAMLLNRHDVCLVDYRLGAQNGVDLLRAALEHGCLAPVILLTGIGEHQIDVEAMQAGAADYLVKSQLRPDSLERSLRYALQRKRAANPTKTRPNAEAEASCSRSRSGPGPTVFSPGKRGRRTSSRRCGPWPAARPT